MGRITSANISNVGSTNNRVSYIATAGQTVFTVNYDVGSVDVYLNGAKLLLNTDFTASTGTSIVLSSGANVNDVMDIIGYGTFTVANTYSKTVADTTFQQKLVSGTNINTINGNSLLGSGDIVILGVPDHLLQLQGVI
jgi:hypothetical protein